MTKPFKTLRELAQEIDRDGPLQNGVLASAFAYPAPTPSKLAKRAAQQMVGAVATAATRVDHVEKLAALLDSLKAADAGKVTKSPSKRRTAS